MKKKFILILIPICIVVLVTYITHSIEVLKNNESNDSVISNDSVRINDKYVSNNLPVYETTMPSNVMKGKNIYLDIELLPNGSFIPSNVMKGKDIYLDIELLPNGSFIPSNVMKGKDIYLDIELLPNGSYNIF